jgi:hypothetical protein
MPVSTTLRRGLSRTNHAVTGASFMKTSHPPVGQVRKSHFDLVVGINPHARRAVLSHQPVSHRLARIAPLHPNGQTVEVVDTTHVWQPNRIDDQRLTREKVGLAEIRDLLALGRDGRTGGDAVIGSAIKTGEDAVHSNGGSGNAAPTFSVRGAIRI